MRYLALATLALTAASVEAATVNYSTTTVGNRVVTSTAATGALVNANAVAVGSLVRLGTMTNENDYSTFMEFGRSTIASNGAFTGGVISGSVTNNTDTAGGFASRTYYIAVFNAAAEAGASFGGVFKSTAAFDPTVSSSSSQTFTLAVNSFTTAVNPATGWAFLPSSVNATGITGAAGNPATDRTGIVFDLGAAVPEPGVSILALASLGLLARRRRN